MISSLKFTCVLKKYKYTQHIAVQVIAGSNNCLAFFDNISKNGLFIDVTKYPHNNINNGM